MVMSYIVLALELSEGVRGEAGVEKWAEDTTLIVCQVCAGCLCGLMVSEAELTYVLEFSRWVRAV